jgi:uridine kinase
VTGGTASGKTTVCMAIIQRLGAPSVTVLGMDRFYRSLQPDAPAHLHNFDVPDAFDFEMFLASIQQLVTSRSVPVPKYSYRTHQRLQDVDVIDQADVVIVEGILTLYHPEVRKLLDMKIYVDTDDDVRLARRSQNSSGRHSGCR